MSLRQTTVFLGVLTGLACGGGGYGGGSNAMGGVTSTTTVVQPHAGNNQSATAGTAFATALQASVVIQQTVDDGYGSSHMVNTPESGATVTFTIVAGLSGASGTFPGSATTAMATTDASGYASAPALTANGTAGAFTVTAVTAGGSGPATFTLTNL